MSDREAFEAWWIDYRGFPDPHDGYAWAAWQAALAAQQKAEPVALHIDDAECVMYDALGAAHKRGPVSDDKVLLDELAKRGVFLARCAAPLDAEGLRLLQGAKRNHRYFDTGGDVTSCPAADGLGPCDCGADEWNARIDAYLAKYSVDQP